jgi:hypothetical protein
MPYTLGGAAKATGKSKATVLLSIRKGRISAQKDDFGRYQIDPAELHRVYALLPVKGEAEHDEPHLNAHKIELLQEKISFLERELARLERTEADTRDDRDHWRRQATAQLPPPKPEPAPLVITPPRPFFWPWPLPWFA